MKIDDEIKSSFASPQQKAIVNVKFTSNFMGSFQNKFMAEYDLSMAQFNILRILRGAKKPLKVNTVKDRMIEKSPNTTRLMDKLLDKQLIKRHRCETDRRVVFVEIADMGLKLLAEIDKKIKDSSLMPSSLTDEESEQLSYLLDKLREGFN